MKHKYLPHLSLLVVLCVLVLGNGCSKGSDKDVLARINGKDVITLRDFNNRIAKLPERYQNIINKNKKDFLDELIVDALLHKEALRKKLDKDEDVREVVEEAKKKILMARLLQKEVEEKIVISDEEIGSFYSENKEQFAAPEVLRASHILVKTEKEAKDVLAELSSGKNFEDIARIYSIDPTSKVGGDIGYFTRNQLVPEFEETCFDMQVGETSGIVLTNFGYHIIRLVERKGPQIKELSEVRGIIEQSLQRRKKKIIFGDFVGKLKEKSKITINEDLLKEM